jgi:hypothetical protein
MSRITCRWGAVVVTLTVLAALVPAAVGAARPFQLRLFSAEPAGGVPLLITQNMATNSAGVDLRTIVTLGTVQTPAGTIELYAARRDDLAGMLVMHAVGSQILGGGSSRVEPVHATPLRLFISQGSDLQAGPEIPGVVGPHVTRVRMLFADHTSLSLPLRARMFDYVVGGVRCQPGRRPIAIQALDARGTVNATVRLAGLARLERDAPPGSGCPRR